METDHSEPPVSAVFSTGRWAFRVLGGLLAASTLISVLRQGFNIQLVGLPNEFYAQYVWLRDTIFWPLTGLLSLISIRLPDWAKDMIALYFLIAGAVWRALPNYARFHRTTPDRYGHSAATYTPDEEDRRIFLVMSLVWPVWLWIMGEAASKPDKVRRIAFFRFTAIQLLFVIVCTVGFFFWNYLAHLYGPPG